MEPPHDTDQKGATFFLYVHELSERAVLTLCADLRFLGPRKPSGFLLDLEWLAVEALRTDAGPPLLAEALARRWSSPGPEGHGAGTGLPSTSARREKPSPP
ncbi:hypothetical protein [Streptosporangium sp. NPDC002721]|uniref:hypothetical protein n=1 Tax=Streptosporangium sp. NPDC002721 TaxID=3366188 RepID=UPI0036D0EF49